MVNCQVFSALSAADQQTWLVSPGEEVEKAGRGEALTPESLAWAVHSCLSFHCQFMPASQDSAYFPTV